MKSITLSLLLVVMLSSLFIGWIIDFAYNQNTSSIQTNPENQLSLLTLAGEAIANNVDSASDKLAYIDNWQSGSGIILSLIEFDDVSLPSVLRDQLTSGQPIVLESAHGPSLYYYLPSTNQLLLLHSNTLMPSSDRTTKWMLTIIFYVGLSLLLTLWVYPLARRLLTLRNAATAFGKGKLNTRVKVGTLGGIRDLELEFNRMASQVETLLTDIKLLSGGVSHDLKTPLSRIRFGIDAIQDEPDLAHDNYVSRLSDDTDEMIRLVNTMLEYTRLDLTPSSLLTERLELNDLMTAVVCKFESASIPIGTNTPAKPTYIDGHAVYLEVMLSNVLSNAQRYANTTINVSLVASENTAQIIVADDGDGIAQEYLNDIFKPLFRVPEQDIQQNVKNYGLGLAMVKRIVEMHGGIIICKSAGGNNQKQVTTQMLITLPLASLS